MTYASLDALSAAISEMGQYPADYWDKMFHRLPQAPSVDRVAWLTARCKDQVVLHLGCEGPLHSVLAKHAAALYGVDKLDKQAARYYSVDLDEEPQRLPQLEDVTLLLAAEVLEHLTNPGWCLRICRQLYPTVPLVVTAPNAFAPQAKLKQGWECVNKDHVAWYSPQTLRVLLTACGYTVTETYYYNGVPPYCEGLIMVAQP